MLKQKLSPMATAAILLIALAGLGGFFAYTWAFAGRQKGVSLSEAMALDKKNMAARGEKPPPPNPNAPKMAGPPSQYMKGAAGAAVKK